MPAVKGSSNRAQRGFTLLEIAVVVLIIGLILGAIVVPLTTQLESRRIDESEQILAQAREALFAYAHQYGYFPCPADAAGGGVEAKGTDHGTGACPVWHGFLPASSLRFSPRDDQGYAVDPWNNRIRYAVSNHTVAAIVNPFTKLDGMRSAGMPSLTAAALFHVCASGSGVNAGVDCGTAKTLSSNVAIVVWSVGPNGASGGTSVDEGENPNPNGGSADRVFVSRGRTDIGGAQYDDQLTWIATPMMLARLTAEGVTLTRRAPSGAPGAGAPSAGGGGGTPTKKSDDDDD